MSDIKSGKTVTLPYEDYEVLSKSVEELKEIVSKQNEDLFSLSKGNGNSILYVDKWHIGRHGSEQMFINVHTLITKDDYDKHLNSLKNSNYNAYYLTLKNDYKEDVRKNAETLAKIEYEKDYDDINNQLKELKLETEKEKAKMKSDFNEEMNRIKLDFNNQLADYKEKVRKSFWRKMFRR